MPKISFIQTEIIAENVHAHLERDHNACILFSASFDTETSIFFGQFFGKRNRHPVLKLYPVNYSVSANQEMFELIKYKLLYELFSNFPEQTPLDQERFSVLLVNPTIVSQKMKIDTALTNDCGENYFHAALRRPNPYWFVYNAYKICREKRYVS